MWTRQSWWLGVGLAFGLVLTTAAQPFNTQIQIAITNLTTGVTPFTQLVLGAARYINWGATAGSTGYGIRDNAGVIESKNSGGAWTPVISGMGAPTDASFWTRVSEAGLTNESVMASLATGLVINTTATGTPTAYAGTSCTNQFVRSLSAIGAATCATVTLSSDTTGTLTVSRGGTGLTTGQSGGILGFTASGTLASSGALTANMLVMGGGTGATPVPLGTLGTTTTVLHGNAAGLPTFGAVVLTTDVSGILPTANGGTGNAFFALSGPATSTKTYTFPNASTTVLTTNAAVTPAQGGTGLSSYTVGDLLYATGATTLAALADASTGNALISGGVGVAPSYGKIGLTTHISGTLAAANGGTGNASYAVGDLLYATGATTLARLADVATGSVLISGGVGVAPSWSTSPAITALTVTGAAVSNTLTTLRTTATNDDPTEILSQYRVATTDATPTALATLAVPSTTTRQIFCYVTARRTGGVAGTAEDGAGYTLQAVYKNVAGTATEIAAETLTVVGEDQAGWTIAIAPSAGNAVISVTGATDNSVTWHSTCRTYAVGS